MPKVHAGVLKFGRLKLSWNLGFGDLELSCRRHGLCSFIGVETAKHSVRKVAADPDIFFHCQHCKAALVVNRSAEGMTLTCQKCSKLTTVPKLEEPNTSTLVYAEEIRRKLTENESQRAEVTGNINQLTIQLHRWQLRLQTLNDRKAQLEKELGPSKV
jgi:DNA-directed RNA polymerase subunit M/transcription elongation factor TFIIS